MLSTLAWNQVAELFVSCSPGDIDNDFQRAEEEVNEIVNSTGLSPAQRHRLRADIIKAALQGFGQIARAGDCVYIIIQMYIKETGLVESTQDLQVTSNVDVACVENQSLQTESPSKTSRHSGWGYFLIERVADRQENDPAASSYLIEVFLYREG